MVFWIVSIAMSAVVSGLCFRSLFQKQPSLQDSANYDIAVYRDQLASVEDDLKRGLINESDAQLSRTEISRRILARDAQQQAQSDASKISPKAIAALSGLIFIAGSYILYAGAFGFQGLGANGYQDMGLKSRVEFAKTIKENRPTQAQAEARFLAQGEKTTQETSAEFLDLIKKLRLIVQERPDDLQGHILLSQNEYRLQNYAASRKAMERVLQIKGDDVTLDDLSNYLDLQVISAGGFVSIEAEETARLILSQDAEHGISLYYMGLMMSQTGRPDVAFRIWERLLRKGAKDGPWVAPISERIEQMAQLAGVKYTLPENLNAALNGPTEADISSANAMTPQQRDQMIASMVQGLSDRLATEGGTAEEWARLIRALRVLGRDEQAKAIAENARAAFVNQNDALNLIEKAVTSTP